MIPAGLTFDAERHEYRWQGQIVPGVTTILQPLVDFSRVPLAVLNAKRQLGQDVHLACELHDENDLDEDTVSEAVAPYLAAYRRFLAETGAEVIAAEQLVFEPLLRYAGTLDRVMQIHGDRWLVDLKTPIVLPAAVGPQTAAYMRALKDATVTRRGALRLRPDGTYRLDSLTDPDDMAVFHACLSIHRFKEKHP